MITQVERNIIAKMDRLGLWEVSQCSTYVVEPDRIFFTANPGMSQQLHHLSARGRLLKDRISKRHNDIYSVFLLPRHLELRSYREVSRPSLQVVFTIYDCILYGEADIDLANPLMDLWGMIVHLVELIIPGKTDHEKVARLMRKQGYDV